MATAQMFTLYHIFMNIFLFSVVLISVGLLQQPQRNSLPHSSLNNQTNNGNIIVIATMSDSSNENFTSAKLPKQFLLAFSLKKNLSALTQPHKNLIDGYEIGSVNGIKLISMIWVIVMHSYSFARWWMTFTNQSEVKAIFRPWYMQFIANGSLYIDNFLFTSGLTVVLTNNSNIIRRYLRLATVMMLTILFSVVYLPHLGSGKQWQQSTIMFDLWCRKNWWINLLMLHNFIDHENMCLSHSWYTALDMQMFLLSLPLFYLLKHNKKFQKLGLIITTVCIVLSQILVAILTVWFRLPPAPLVESVSESVWILYYKLVYIKPYCRAGPYLMGMMFGQLMRKSDLPKTISKPIVIVGWSVAGSLYCFLLMSMYPGMNGYVYSAFVSALYSSLSRPLWAISTCWVVYACITGHGGAINGMLSCKIMAPLSRLSYSAFLTHPIIMVILYGNQRSPIQFSHHLMLYFILGHTILTYLMALVLTLTVEMPILSMEKTLWSGRSLMVPINETNVNKRSS